MNGLRCALAMFSGRTILYFGISERLRAFRYPIFTGEVVEENSGCSAAFCESAALRRRLWVPFNWLALSGFASQIHLSQRERRPSQSAPAGRIQLPRRGSLVCADRKIHKSSPFGGAGIEQGEMTERARRLPHHAAISPLRPSREKCVWSTPQSATNAKITIILPLIMPIAQRRAF